MVVQTVLASQNTSTAASADDVYAMSSLDLSDVMDDFSQMNVLSVVVACLLMVCLRSSMFDVTGSGQLEVTSLLMVCLRCSGVARIWCQEGHMQKLLGFYRRQLSTYSRCQTLYRSKCTGKIKLL